MRRIAKTFIMLASLLFTSCGGGGSSPEPLRSDPSLTDDNPATAPLVDISFNGFNPETTTLRFSEGQIITFRVDMASDSVDSGTLSQTSGPVIDFGTASVSGRDSNGDLDISSGDNPFELTLFDVEGTREIRFDRFSRPTVEFRAPSVTQRTTLNFRFQSRGGSTSRDRTIPIIIEDDATAITLTGQVSKGLVMNSEVELFSVDSLDLFFSGNREIIDPVDTDETGTFNFTVLPATDLEELLRFEVEGDDADMVCDAPRGCNDAAFGEVFEVEDDLDLRALIEVPLFGTTRIVNINILTSLATERAGQLNNLRRVSPRDLEDATSDVASVFGITNQDYTTVPFIDVTQPFTSSNEDAIRAAMIGGGVLGAAFLHSDPDDDEDYLEEIDDFIDEFETRRVFCQDAPNQTTMSIEDIMSQALEVARINGDALTQSFFQNRVNAIRNGSFSCNFFTPPLP